MTEVVQQTNKFIECIEHKNVEAVAAMLHPAVMLAHPMALSGNRKDVARWLGKEHVLAYFGGAFTMMERIRFTNRRISVANSGETSFVQADGDITTDDGRPYQNVYIFRIDWQGERVIVIEEYANPLTFCQTFSNPLCG